MPNYAAIALLAVCLSGCTDMPWERSLYEGVRSSADQCRASARPSNAPCPTVPDYSRYEKERSRAKGD